MYGYIRPRIDELKVRQEAEYRAAYCGLCRCLGKRHGLIARFLVNYDITFAWLLIAGHGELSPCSRQFCPANPLKKKACRAMDPAMEYCADLCVILCAASGALLLGYACLLVFGGLMNTLPVPAQLP